MSMTTELIERLKKYAQILEDTKITNADLMCVKSMREAANTIEELSAKLHAANMERSSQYYHGGWIPCQDKMPQDNQDVLVQMSDGSMMVDCRAASSAGWFWAEENDLPVAWRPLPAPYSPNDSDKEIEDEQMGTPQ